MEETTKIVKIETSFFPGKIQKIAKDQFAMPTWIIIVFLIITFFVLKFFIYLPDEKRKGK